MTDILKNKDLIFYILRKIGIKDALLEPVWKIISSTDENIFINDLINFVISYHSNNFTLDFIEFINKNNNKSFSTEFYVSLISEFSSFGIIGNDLFEEKIINLPLMLKSNDSLNNKPVVEIPLNDELVDYIDDNMLPSDDKITIAYAIYYLLGKILCYDYSFAAVKDHLTLSRYYEVSPENPYVICDTWAMIYYLLLRRYGIDAAITVDEKHTYVIIDIHGMKITADGTKFMHDSSLTYISDLANIKYGFPTINFQPDHNVANTNLNLDTKLVDAAILYVTSYYGEVNNRDVYKEINEFKRQDNDDLLSNIERRFEYLTEYYLKLPKECFMEKRQFFEKYFPILFENYNYEMISLLFKINGKFCTRRVIIFITQGETINFIESNSGFRIISSQELDNLNEQSKNNYSEVFEDKHIKKRS